ncbi:hypothetical protein GCM10007916_22980 [Psychromonas marina]|uniref:DUF481 domain-containing protein n=1 Tax=Psychromonas marina TaxID=88364 RepID=A0ABQ6E1A4_9GAMM|nr:hypothetical protein [Psychromonas marina]GLS91229.1 hypothetical protein GCM10007916_22980 [Psychromonas marina]
MMNLRFPPLMIVLTISILSSSHVMASEGEIDKHWNHSIELYGQALNIRGDSTVGDLSTSVDVDPRFIMDHIDIGAMLRLQGVYENNWGYYIDYAYMKLSGKSDAVLGTDLSILNAKLDIRQGVLEAKAFKRYQYEHGTLDYMFGIRWWDNDIESSLYTNNGIIDNNKNLKVDWIDYLIGIRYITELSQHWAFHFSLDAGVGSDTDFTSSIQTGVRYTINEWSDMNIAYKSTWVDYDNQDDFAYNTATQGFLIGFAVHF